MPEDVSPQKPHPPCDPSEEGRGGARLLAILLLIVTVAVYAPVAHNGFVTYDDDGYVTNNAMVRAGLTGRGFVWAFTAIHEANWHPLTWLSHMADCQLFGLDPRGHHLMNLAFHGANTLLLFLLLVRLFRAPWRSAAVALLFAVHPLHVESVAWVAERKDLLAALFWFLALVAYLRYAKGPTIGRYLAVLALFVLGLLAKPMVVTLPLILLLVDWWPLGRFTTTPLRRLLVEKVPFLLISLGSALITVVAQKKGDTIASLTQISLDERLANIPVAYVRYLVKMVWPADLAVFYPYPHLSWWEPVAALGLLAVVTTAAVRLRRERPWLLFGWLWYLVILLPVIGIVQVGLQSMADRYTYLSLIGPFLALVWGAAELCRRLPQRRMLLGFLAVAVMVPLALLARRQTGFWRDSMTLFTHAAAAVPGNFIALNNLGTLYADKGMSAEGDRFYREALRANPSYAQAWYNLGVSLDAEGRIAEAQAHFAEAVRLRPSFAEAHYNLAITLGKQGRVAEAVGEFREAVRLNPDWSEARRKLAGAEWLLSGSGR
ncbi:MAG TPA: tetratricopeptide repeat protein [Geobacteraceae bacterium]